MHVWKVIYKLELPRENHPSDYSIHESLYVTDGRSLEETIGGVVVFRPEKNPDLFSLVSLEHVGELCS